MNYERLKDRREVIRRIANTTDGMMYIKYDIEDYIVSFKPDFSCPNKMYFDLGIQKRVKEMLKMVEDKERFERIIICSKFDKNEDMP